MVVIEPFEVEKWMDAYETTPGVVNIAETCSASISIDELVDLSADKTTSPFNTSIPLAYGPIRGSASLRSNIAAIYSKDGGLVQADDVLVTQGAIGANFLVLYTLVGPGDHIICVHPTYNQLSAVPKSLGADVSLWNLKAENGFVPDVSELGGLVKRNTKMIIINNPNNPTGATIPKSILGDIVEFARSRDIIVFSDEVYWPLFHSLPEGSDAPPSVLSFDYDKSISTGSMSKTYALAGLRLGWIASRDKAIIEALASARDYTTISVSLLNDQVASYALSAPVLPALMERNLSLCRRNLEQLSEFVERNSAHCKWVKPTAGTTAFVQFRKDGEPVDDVDFCIDLLNATKVMFVPGNKCFAKSDEFPGYVRIGYACETDVLERGLKLLEEYVKEKLASA